MSNKVVTLDVLEKIYGKKFSSKQKANAQSVVLGLEEYGKKAGVDKPHRLAQYLPQLFHESGAFIYDREVWGPTAAQKRYEGRKDLGNTQKGDGSKFRGYGPIQITGRANTTAFYKWCVEKFGKDKVPNFVEDPSQINTDPWEGLGPLWYWETRNINKHADQGDIEMVTKVINGGLNGYEDRVKWYSRTALVLLGYGPDEVKKFQRDKKVPGGDDGIPGAKTRSALHKALILLDNNTTPAGVMSAPVVEETKVVPKTVDNQVKEKTNLWSYITGGAGTVLAGGAGLVDFNWQVVGIIALSTVALIVVLLLLKSQLLSFIKDVRAATEN